MKVPGIRGEVYLHITAANQRSFGWDEKSRRFEPGGEYKASSDPANPWNGIPTVCSWGMHGSTMDLFFYPFIGNWVSVVRIWGNVDNSHVYKVVGLRRKYVATRQIKATSSSRRLIEWSERCDGVAIAEWVLAKPYKGIIAAGYHPRKG